MYVHRLGSCQGFNTSNAFPIYAGYLKRVLLRNSKLGTYQKIAMAFGGVATAPV